jgi:hypothetical protein
MVHKSYGPVLFSIVGVALDERLPQKSSDRPSGFFSWRRLKALNTEAIFSCEELLKNLQHVRVACA